VSNLIPVPMTKGELLTVLADVAHRIHHGDSWEGNLQWEMPDESDGPDVKFRVRGAYRIGNADGSQGGMRLIGTVP